jgi:PAS domain S-box-containing protein
MSVPVFDGNKIVAIVGVGNKPSVYDETDLRQLHLFMNNMWDTLKIRRATQLLVKERDTLQMYLNVAAGIVVVLDREGNIKLLNKRGCDILGCISEDAIIGKNWFDIFIPEVVRAEVRKIHTDIISGKTQDEGVIVERENAVLTAYGDERIIRWRNTVFKDENGELYQTLSYGTDITEQRRLEQERNNHWSKLEEELKENLNNLKMGEYSNGYHGLSKAKQELDKAVSAMAVDLGVSNSNLKVVK